MANMGLLYPKRPLLPLKLLIAFNSAKKGFSGNSDPSRTPEQFSAMPQHERHAPIISSFRWHYCCNMTTRQKQRATKYLSKVSRGKKAANWGGEGEKGLGKPRWKSTLRAISLKNKQAFHPPAAAYSQVTEISLRLKICSSRCYDPSYHSSPRNQVAGSCDGQMHGGEKPSGCWSCSGSRSPLWDQWSTPASAAWGAGTGLNLD